MRPILNSSKGVSTLVAYVLLISLTLSLSAIVYSFIVFLVPQKPVECPSEVNIVVKEYACTPNTGSGTGEIRLVIQNRGMFSVDGFYVRASDSPNSTFGIKQLGKEEDLLHPGEETEPLTTEPLTYNYGSEGLENLTIIEVQPFIDEKSNRILCQDYTKIQVNCTE